MWNECFNEEYLLKLLGRETVSVPETGAEALICGKTVLVTGGSGFIGSEICRKVAAYGPKKLVIVDIYENNAYMLQQELLLEYGADFPIEVYITSVCDRVLLGKIFSEENPDTVIHSAAHKHVPLMEKVPQEAVKNNVFGTLNTIKLSVKHGVETFVLVSTDKAVNPTSVMGATKRICEMITQKYAENSAKTRFSAVRFGNVIGSSGSVVPLFRQQIKRGVVTVSHPEIYRYFMTVSEAAQLVLSAATLANGGEIFVLDMGEPVNIANLARKMLELEGSEEGKNVELQYTDLRPGEKLYEELLLSQEGLKRTSNRKIFVGEPVPLDGAAFEKHLENLRIAVKTNATDSEILALLKEIVPEYRRL